MNRTILSNLFIFAAGTAIGSVVTWKLVKNRYEQIANEEIASVKETFNKKLEDSRPFEKIAESLKEVAEKADKTTESLKEVAEKTDKTTEKPDIMEYAKILNKENYTQYSEKEDATERTVEELDKNKPYVIPPEDFDDNDYEVVSLVYYADNYLAYEDGELVDDVEDLVGWDSLEHFGEYEDDSVFVRNDRLGIDFEILADVANYMDIVKKI